MRQKINANYIDSVVVLILGIGILVLLPLQVKSPDNLEHTLTSPLLFPRIVSWTLIILSLFRLFTVLVKKETKETKETKEIKEATFIKKQWLRFISSLVIIVVYILLIPFLGFLLATILATFSLISLLGDGKWYKQVILSTIITVPIWFVFVELLNVPLPKGFLGI